MYDGDRPRIAVWDARTGEQKWMAKQLEDSRDDSLYFGPIMSTDGRRSYCGERLWLPSLKSDWPRNHSLGPEGNTRRA